MTDKLTHDDMLVKSMKLQWRTTQGTYNASFPGFAWWDLTFMVPPVWLPHKCSIISLGKRWSVRWIKVYIQMPGIHLKVSYFILFKK